MSLLSLASDFVKLLKEQISILDTIASLNRSLEKLLQQKSLPEKWTDLDLSVQPRISFLEVIDSKANIIKTELKRLR